MSPTDDRREVPPAVGPVVRRYRRLERASGWALAIGAAVVAVVAILALPLGPGVLVAAVVLAALRVPVVRRRGTARLTTDADPAAVAAEFAGPTPPPLVFQWGVADEIRSTGGVATYEFSYLFGLRSVSMTVEVRSRDPDGDADEALELEVSAGGMPWARYAVSVWDSGEGSVVEMAVVSSRRFGLRRLPQGLVAGRYYADALAAQGYAVADRTSSFSIRDFD
ncbi:hypothetical protein [Saliphagus sp. LR7]|uniref:hypothetical protein n=1 Tax=Saliphagus sp. LR7 TaxID=2282654 RepID=UPI000DF84624|nr:hypothetical protein [Saliphagus sp. LR7]